MCAYKPNAEKKEIGKAHWLANLTKLVSSRFIKRCCLKDNVENDWNTLDVILWPSHTCTCVHVNLRQICSYTHINMHTHTYAYRRHKHTQKQKNIWHMNYNVDEHYSKWNKPNTIRQIYCDTTHMSQRSQNHLDKKVEWWFLRTWGGEECGFISKEHSISIC